jgi:hypothetical protein
VLTLPVTLVTLGLFLFVINALMFWAAAGVLDGFRSRLWRGAAGLADLFRAGHRDRISAREPVREQVLHRAQPGVDDRRLDVVGCAQLPLRAIRFWPP